MSLSLISSHTPNKNHESSSSSNTIDYKNIAYFSGLNSLRCIAALLVLFHHGEKMRLKYETTQTSYKWLGFFNNGGYAVTFFFVLSGFLITYLLLKERNKTQTIRVKNFYLKRIFRIWPLYFLLVLIGTVALPFIFDLMQIKYEFPYSLGETWYYFIFFLPGLVTFYFGHHILEPLWSIGVEETFYLFWAPLVKKINRFLLYALLSIVILKILLQLIGLCMDSHSLYNFLVNNYKLEAMSIGGIGAYLIFHHGDKLLSAKIFSVKAQVVVFLTLLTFMFFHSNIHFSLWNYLFRTPIFSTIMIEILFLYVILCVSSIDKSIIKLQNPILNYLGEISYGIYMYHMLVIFTTAFLFKNMLLSLNPWISFILFYSIVISLTIGVSTLSKVLFENYFLRMKQRLT